LAWAWINYNKPGIAQGFGIVMIKLMANLLPAHSAMTCRKHQYQKRGCRQQGTKNRSRWGLDTPFVIASGDSIAPFQKMSGS
jgi:hypothetical protein